ncbi:unnamed protein product, partial [Didymodactylos carnosus]
PQAGKSACDRYAAVIKGNVRRYLNEKHNVTNAAEFVEACHSYNGVKGVQAFECDLLQSEKESTVTFTKITSVNNFGFEKNGIRVHRAWKVGGGKLIPWKDLKCPNILDELVFRTTNTTSHTWVYGAKSETKKESAKAMSSVTTADITEVREDVSPNKLYECPEEGCTAAFARNGNLINHIANGKHQRRPERHLMRDYAMQTYHSKLEDIGNVL